MTVGPRYVEAVDYAREVHAGDIRKATRIPYLAHLLSVSALVLEDGGDEDEAIGGLLHDTAEDHGGVPRLEDVERRFGRRVREIVEACSDSLDAEDTPKAPWRERKERYLAHLASSRDSGALRVSAADKLHNSRAILADFRRVGDAVWQRFSASHAADQLWYYRSLADVLGERLPDSAVVGELRHTVAELERTVGG